MLSAHGKPLERHIQFFFPYFFLHGHPPLFKPSPSPTMEIPQHIFLVQSLKSFHTGTKAKVDARKRFDDANRQPKLPALVGALKAVKDKKHQSKSIMRTVSQLPDPRAMAEIRSGLEDESSEAEAVC